MSLAGSDVSVLIPAFNAQQFIDAAIESVVNQTVRPGEIIVVDDGSTDATATRCEAWGSVVRLLRRENAGPGRARNIALQAASGSVVALLDADDQWLPHKTEVQLAHLAAQTSDVAVFGWMQNFLDPDAHLIIGPNVRLEVSPAFQTSTLMLHRSVFDVIGPFDEIGPYQGWVDWYLRLRESGLAVGMVQQLVTMRRIHENNLTIRHHAEQREYHRFLHESLQRRRAKGSL